MAITPFKAIQGHLCRYQSKARMRLPINTNWHPISYCFEVDGRTDRQTERRQQDRALQSQTDAGEKSNPQKHDIRKTQQFGDFVEWNAINVGVIC